MFVEEPKSADLRKLVFLRSLAEFGLLEHPTASNSPSGIIFDELTPSQLKQLEQARLGIAVYSMELEIANSNYTEANEFPSD